ncbi:hypothetical protein VTK73DRAFT_8836 [Phialemonium thermophilum]|uniref:Uncharacterized protein n=1 Tax=Phialemonium thermophilum TaxID=223376 RepID=A0ABR3XNC6_9PEZI
MGWLMPLQMAWAVLSVPLAFGLRLILGLFSSALGIFLFLISPLVYMVQLFLAPLYFFFHFLPALKPLYVFFGCAAMVGITTGIALRLTSNALGSIFKLSGDSAHAQALSVTSSSVTTPAATPPLRTRARLPPSSDVNPRDVPDMKVSDWQWFEVTPRPAGRKRERPGLLSQTILEEADDS